MPEINMFCYCCKVDHLNMSVYDDCFLSPQVATQGTAVFLAPDAVAWSVSFLYVRLSLAQPYIDDNDATVRDV